jgi:hypothetical protein
MIDMIRDNPGSTEEKKEEEINRWTTEIKKTLRGGGAFTRLNKVRTLVGQRFPKRKETI